MNFRQHCEQAKAKSARYMWVVFALSPLHLLHSLLVLGVLLLVLVLTGEWWIFNVVPFLLTLQAAKFWLKSRDKNGVTFVLSAFKHRTSFCKNCGEQRFERVRTKHVRHLVFTFLSFGLWVIGWFTRTLWNQIRRWRCTECGAKKFFGVEVKSSQRLATPDGENRAEEKLLNVVEEMAIATGLPVPTIRLIEANEEEETRWQPINAFAAGSKPEDAMVGVCRESLGKLNRSELQGMIAHIFGQMLNGDLRLNNALKALSIRPILLRWVIASPFLLFASGYLSDLIVSSIVQGGGSIKLKMVLMMVIFFAILAIMNLPATITNAARNAISRERKFFADATAVRLVLDPTAIANALKKMAFESNAMISRSKAKASTPDLVPPSEVALKALEGFLERFALGIKGSRALDHEVAHSFFGDLQAESSPSHPTTEKRILRIEPEWDGDLAQMESKKVVAAPTPASKARSLLDSLPALIIHQARDTFDARCVLYALLLDKDEQVRSKQLQTIRSDCDNATAETTEAISPVLTPLSPVQKMALVDLALPPLAELAPKQYEVFRRVIQALIVADEKIDLFEWSLRQVLDYRLQGRFGKDEDIVRGNSTIENLKQECILVIAGIAHFGQGEAPPEPAFQTGLAAMTIDGDVPLPAPDECGIMQIAEVVEKLKLLSDSSKETLLEACNRTIEHDRKTSDVEYQILRGVAAGLSCPLPPILGSGELDRQEI